MQHARRLLILIAILLATAACQTQSEPTPDAAEALAALPEGDPARGETLYNESINNAPTCASCHALTDQRMLGPGLQNYSQIAADRVDDQTAGEYTYHAIVNPSDYVVSGYSDLMYAQYGQDLSDQELADLIAYLLTL